MFSWILHSAFGYVQNDELSTLNFQLPMHLFITQPHIKDNILTLTEEGVVHQLVHVLRVQPGEQLCVQRTTGEETQRWKVTCVTCTKKAITTSIIDCQTTVKKVSNVRMAIAFPNKRDKAELIVQKLTEIGVGEIIFFPAQRSVLRDCPEKKLQRMHEIAREAVEQSWGRFLPTITCKKNLTSCHTHGQRLLLADGNGSATVTLQNADMVAGDLLCIGPEGGFTPEEVAFGKEKGMIVGLGNTVLRMETAAIVGARVQVQKNLL